LKKYRVRRGYPTYLASSLASFCEGTGVVDETLGGRIGSLSMVLSALPPGEDFTEPLTQSLLRTCGTLLMLDSSLAHARHFPAINWSHSYSLFEEKLLPHFIDQTSEEWTTLRDYCRAHCGAGTGNPLPPEGVQKSPGQGSGGGKIGLTPSLPSPILHPDKRW
jgi:vacuolar-type H+-ATPase catalytic subunit A/Vma1